MLIFFLESKIAAQLLQCVPMHCHAVGKRINFSINQPNGCNAHVTIKWGIGCVSFRYKFFVHNTSTIKKLYQHRLIFDFWNLNFFGLDEFFAHLVALCLFISRSYEKHQLSSPVIIESKKFGSCAIISRRSLPWTAGCFHCSAVNVSGTNRAHSFRFFKSSARIQWTMVFGIPYSPLSSYN